MNKDKKTENSNLAIHLLNYLTKSEYTFTYYIDSLKEC